MRTTSNRTTMITTNTCRPVRPSSDGSELPLPPAVAREERSCSRYSAATYGSTLPAPHAELRLKAACGPSVGCFPA
jgi:hypothetical protein